MLTVIVYKLPFKSDHLIRFKSLVAYLEVTDDIFEPFNENSYCGEIKHKIFKSNWD